MIEISYKKPNILCVKNADKKEITFDTELRTVMMDDFNVTYQGEYEKSGNLLEVKEYTDLLFYKFLIDSKHMCIIYSDSFELKEEIVSFFWDVDILIIIWTKDAVKIFENIEAKVVVPYGAGKDIFLNTVGQHPEAVKTFKVMADLDGDRTEFVNLEG